jgi:hypothetical protein
MQAYASAAFSVLYVPLIRYHMESFRNHPKSFAGQLKSFHYHRESFPSHPKQQDHCVE